MPALSTPAESDLEIVSRHVKNAEARVATQRKLIALLAVRRQPLKQANELLHLLEETSRVQAVHLVEMEEIVSRRARPRRIAGTRIRYREASESLRLQRI